MQSLKHKVIHGVIWRMLEQFGTQAITFVVSIILARLLGPDEFGTVALLSIFLALSNCLINSGLGIALVQKKDTDDLDFNSVFYLHVGIGIFVYLVLWFCAPLIAAFYGKPVLVAVLRVSALKLIFDSVSGVQNAVLTRNMLFKLGFRITLSGTIVGGVSGIWMAYAGYGLWALVWSSLLGGGVAMIVRWALIGWRPRLMFSWQRTRGLFRYGSKLLVSNLLDTFFVQSYGLIIGKVYSVSDLAYYNRGDHLPQVLMSSIQGAIGSVIFPALSKIQDDKRKMKEAMRKVMQTSSFFVFPMMFGLAVVAKPLVLVLLTEKWLPAVPFVQLACISYAFWPIHVANLQAISATGRSDILLKLEIVKKTMLALMLLLTFKHGVLAIMIGRVVLAPVSVFINSVPNKKIIGYSQLEQLKDILPELLLSSIMVFAAWTLSLAISHPLMLICTQILVGVTVYTAGAAIFKLEPAQFVSSQLMKFFTRIWKNKND